MTDSSPPEARLPARKRIALGAHDHEKANLLDWARENRDILAHAEAFFDDRSGVFSQHSGL